MCCRLSTPGLGNGKMVILFKPEDIKTMYSLDGRIPMLPGKSIVKEPKCLLIFSGLNNFEYARAVTLRHRYPTCGLISNKVILDT